MNYGDAGNGTGPEQMPAPQPDTEESTGPNGWLEVLNSFLDRALKADIDTGC